MSDYRHVSHVKSRVVIDESPKLPSADSILYGEIAVNYAKDYETISLKNDEDEIVTFSNDNKIFSAINEVWDAIPEIDETISSSSTNPVQNQAIFNVIKDNEEVTAKAIGRIQESCGLDDTLSYSGPENTTAISDAIDLIYSRIGGETTNEYVNVIDVTSIINGGEEDSHYTEADEFEKAFILRYDGVSTSHHILLGANINIPSTITVDGETIDIDYGLNGGETNSLQLRVDCMMHIDEDNKLLSTYLISYLNNNEQWVLGGALWPGYIDNTGADREYNGYENKILSYDYDFWYQLVMKNINCGEGGNGVVMYDVTDLMGDIYNGETFDTVEDTKYGACTEKTQFELLWDDLPSFHHVVLGDASEFELIGYLRIDCMWHHHAGNNISSDINKLNGCYIISFGWYNDNGTISWSIIGVINPYYNEIFSPVTDFNDDDGELLGHNLTWWEWFIERQLNENKSYVQVVSLDNLLNEGDIPSTEFEDRKYVSTLNPFVLQCHIEDVRFFTEHYKSVEMNINDTDSYSIRVDCVSHFSNDNFSSVDSAYLLSEISDDGINYALLGLVVNTINGETAFVINAVDGSATSLLGKNPEWWYKFAQKVMGDASGDIEEILEIIRQNESVVSTSIKAIDDSCGFDEHLQYEGPNNTTSLAGAVDYVYTTLSGEIEDIRASIIADEKATANALNVVRNSCGFDENGLYSGPSGTTTIDDAVTFLYNKLVAQLALNQSLEERITALENKTVSLHLDDNGVLSVNNE